MTPPWVRLWMCSWANPPTCCLRASALPAWTWATAYYGALASRTSQVMAGELTLEQAFERMDSDIAEKVAQ